MGTVRFLLAALVVVHHVGGAPYVGQHAVLFFYVLSGYLMTLVMHERYGYSGKGLRDFWENRALRLYPAYLAVLLFSCLVLAILGKDVSRAFRGGLYLPSTFAEWIQNVSMLFFSLTPNEVVPRVSPAAWALTVELVFYFLISLGISKTLKRTLIWLALSAVYSVWAALILDFKWSYFSIFSGSLPFSIGALIYFQRERMAKIFAGKSLAAYWLLLLSSGGLMLAIVIIRYLAMFKLESAFVQNIMMPLTAAPAALAVATLISGGGRIFPKKLDTLLGDLSYPVYISHWIFALIAGALLGLKAPSFGIDGAMLMAVSFPMTLIASYLVVRFIDKPINRTRERIRKRSEARLA
ncbi:acyltransferase family protein [Hyphococcus sp.]|uniref:acyltransferase family protein n=1 Tax=Hyphococcus sp. TaxID=2038636 RepID=UPI0035C6677A